MNPGFEFVIRFALWEHTILRGKEALNPHPNLCYFCFFVIVPLISCQTDFYHRKRGLVCSRLCLGAELILFFNFILKYFSRKCLSPCFQLGVLEID